MKLIPRKYKNHKVLIIFVWLVMTIGCTNKKPAIVFQSDFGLKDGAVSAMKGVCLEVDPDIHMYDLTHEIPGYNVWEAAYRLQQTAPYWPSGTVFVSVVDPGVGTERKSIVLKTKTGHHFVGPDNGSFTLVAESLGIDGVRRIDEELNRRRNSSASYTFHGRDVYAYTAARLASGSINFEEVGPLLSDTLVRLNYQRPLMDGDSIVGNIPILDVQYGNVWTNIGDTLFRKLNVKEGEHMDVIIRNMDSVIYAGRIPFVATFGAVPEGEVLSYFNSLMNVAFAINMANFADSFRVGNGPQWNVTVKKSKLGK